MAVLDSIGRENEPPLEQDVATFTKTKRTNDKGEVQRREKLHHTRVSCKTTQFKIIKSLIMQGVLMLFAAAADN